MKLCGSATSASRSVVKASSGLSKRIWQTLSSKPFGYGKSRSLGSEFRARSRKACRRGFLDLLAFLVDPIDGDGAQVVKQTAKLVRLVAPWGHGEGKTVPAKVPCCEERNRGLPNQEWDKQKQPRGLSRSKAAVA